MRFNPPLGPFAERVLDLGAVKAVGFVRSQPVLCIAALAAAASMVAVRQGSAVSETEPK